MFTKAFAISRKIGAASFLIMSLTSIPVTATAQSYEAMRDFCRVSQLLIPIFLEGGNIPGDSVCKSGGGGPSCYSQMSLGAGVCIAGGGGPSCTSETTLGTAVCIVGGVAPSQCSGIGHDNLGEGMCRALGGSSSECSGVRVSQAICSFTGNCEGDDATSIAISMVQTCGAEVLGFGIE